MGIEGSFIHYSIARSNLDYPEDIFRQGTGAIWTIEKQDFPYVSISKRSCETITLTSSFSRCESLYLKDKVKDA